METSVLDAYLKGANPQQSILENNDAETEQANVETTDVESAVEENEDEGEGSSLLDEFISKSSDSNKGEDNKDAKGLDYKSAYLVKVKLGEWQPIDGEDDVEWSEENFNKIAEAQKESTKSPEQKQIEESPISDKQWLINAKEAISGYESLNCDDVEVARRVVYTYEIQERGSSEAISLKKMEALDDEEVVTEAKTIKSKLIAEAKSEISKKEESEKAQKQKEQEAWNTYQNSFLVAGEKSSISKEESLKKIEMIKSGELNKKLWEIIYNPELAHKIIDFISDPNKYETKIENKQKNKLVIEQLTNKNISEALPSKPNKIKIKF